MSMAGFIEDNLESILSDWVRFAATLQPAASHLDSWVLRDYAGEMLRRVASEMASSQSREQQTAKSRGELPEYAPLVTSAAHDHAAHRLSSAFTQAQLIAEFRALRASVVRRWIDQLPEIGRMQIEELIRFNESIDQLLTESLVWYERMLKETQKRLTEVMSQGAERYRILADGSPDATLVHLKDRFIYANPAAARLLGADSPAAVIHRTVLEIIDPDYREAVREYIRLVLSGQLVPMMKLCWRRFDGAPLQVEVAAGLITWDDGDAVQIIARDASARKRHH